MLFQKARQERNIRGKRFNRYKYCINKILNKAYEEEKIIFANRECVISNYGRISFHREFYKIRRVIKKFLEFLDISYKTTTLTSEWITLRNNEIKELMLYVFYADRVTTQLCSYKK